MSYFINLRLFNFAIYSHRIYKKICFKNLPKSNKKEQKLKIWAHKKQKYEKAQLVIKQVWPMNILARFPLNDSTWPAQEHCTLDYPASNPYQLRYLLVCSHPFNLKDKTSPKASIKLYNSRKYPIHTYFLICGPPQ